MSGAQLYDTIGATYTVTRRTDPRIAAQFWAALGDARTVLNVGAGTGSYEPPGRDVTAVEPSAVMRAQRPRVRRRVWRPWRRCLPFEDQSFDAAMAVRTVHHWPDPVAGLREMRRVARRVVVFTHDSSDDRMASTSSGLLATTCPRSLTSSSAGLRWPSWPARSEPAWSRCSFPGTVLTASSRPTGAGPRPTWTSRSAAEYRSGPGSGRRPSSGPSAALRDDLASGRWAERNHDLPLSTRQSLVFASLSAEPVASGYELGQRFAVHR